MGGRNVAVVGRHGQINIEETLVMCVQWEEVQMYSKKGLCEMSLMSDGGTNNSCATSVKLHPAPHDTSGEK